MKLHIGGEERREGWTVLNIADGPCVDIVCDWNDVDLPNESCEIIYASHVLEHLDYQTEVANALIQCHRLLQPGGELWLSVPDLDTICQLFRSPTASAQLRVHLMRVLMGGQTNEYDYHKSAYSWDIMAACLKGAGFEAMRVTPPFKGFEDCSHLEVAGFQISLNVVATKGLT